MSKRYRIHSKQFPVPSRPAASRESLKLADGWLVVSVKAGAA